MLGDLRHACRTILRIPGLATVVVASLAIGIGVNTVVFSWIQAVVFRPIPGVRDASAFHLVEPRTETGVFPAASWPEYRDMAQGLGSFESLLAFRMVPFYVGDAGQVEKGNGMLVSGNYFSALALTPSLGRFFREDEGLTPGGAPVAVISHDYWQAHFGGDASVLGRTIRLNARDLTIVGVGPRGFQGTILGLSFDLFVPATMSPVIFTGSRELEDRAARGYSVMGRLAPAASPSAAQGDVDRLMRELAATWPRTNSTMQAEVRPFRESPRGPQRMLATSLGVLQAVTLLLLLTVCGNTANLVLARASARYREMSVRLALGAGRWRVARLLLAENVLLALAGAVLGVALAYWGTTALNAVPPLRVRGIPIVFRASLDLFGLLFAMGLGLGCGVIFGTAPALHLARLDPQQALRAGATTSPRSRMRYVLMAAEVALALVVLVVAGMFMRSFMETRDAETGFTREGVLLAAYDLTGRNPNEASSRGFAARVLDRLRAEPSIEGAAIASAVPLDIHGLPSRFFILDGRARADGNFDEALANTVTPGYFGVMRIPFSAGRDFVELTDTAAPAQAIVNDEFVKRYVDNGEALGRRIEMRSRTYVITGVVRTTLYNAFGEPPTPIIYFSYRDRPLAIGEIHVRARSGRETAVAPRVRQVVRDIDAELPVYEVRTLGDHIEANLIFRRIPARMFAVLAPLLLLLAATGIYAVVSYTVSLRRMEIGLRLALGASAPRVVTQLVGENLGVVGVGVMAGWILALVIALDVVASRSLDLTVLVGVPVLLLGVAAVACWIPARRAMRVDPMTALRQE